MASRSLGTLTLDVIAKVGGFVGGMDKAGRSSEKWKKDVEKNAKAVGTAIGASVAAGVTALAAFTVSTVNAATEISRLSAVAGSNTDEFQRYAAGAKAVGIESDKFADILKDVNDKVGDFLLNGGGELQDFFKTIAPKVGVTAEQFRNLSGPQALQLFASSLEKAGLSQAEMTQQMESLANDATLLLPLLRDNGAGFDVLGDAAEKAGAIMDEKTIAATQNLAAAGWLAQQSMAGIKNQLASALMPTLSGYSDILFDLSQDTETMTALSEGLRAVMDFAAKTALALAYAVELTGKSISGLVDIIGGSFEGVDLSKPIEAIDKIRENSSKLAGDVGKDLDKLDERYNKLWVRVDQAGSSGQASGKIKEIAGALALVNKEGAKGTFKAPTEEALAAAKAAEQAAKKLQGQFDTAEEGYKRQIALINTETDKRKEATEVAKLQFELESGNLTGLSAKQQERLKGLAAELDQLKKLKQAKEDDKAVAGFDASVKRQLNIDQRALDAPLLNAYSSDEMKQRALDMLAIEQDYQDQLEDLRQRHEAGDVSDSAYERETDILEKALEKRRAMQEKYYEDVDKLQLNGTAGFLSGFATQAEAAMDLYGSMQQVGADTLRNLTDAVTEWAETGKLDIKGFAATFIQSMGHALLSFAAAQVAMAALNAFVSMIGVPFVGPAIAPGAAIAAAGAAGVLMTAVGASLDGQAHDGIDYVPADGTWNLKKGERVTTAETSAKLDRTLDSVAKTSVQPGALKIINNAPPVRARREISEGELAVILDAAEDRIASGFARGTGRVSQAAGAAYGLRRDPK
ncbi:phage tail tape measure C-terminal domain-containing protein [Pseudomonas plecoglossicida]|uniref:phage tail tape measure C-terminal domain-containing protein n=1 Tax=Pseudomonas TaxID=286 RepID=UPI00240F05B6|nr:MULTISPECIES: phage tail tape measure C-terminal domain-containing protein [Pseudomonas]MDN5530933.1 tail tape measure protein [Pseudomonas sp.]MDQ7962757.1 phage tail tape measure C-terminal domain-containing protein [Pseudomonas plecoglossicida]WFG05245.1 phage tail tape measure C-terminal domain-containing protein [Pseudomonas putida]